MHRRDSIEQLHEAAILFFKQAARIEDTKRHKFAAFTGAPYDVLHEVFPKNVWKQKQDEWVLSILRPAMSEAFRAARVREEFTSTEILKRVTRAEIKLPTYYRIARGEWHALASELPTKHDVLMKTLEEWGAERKPIEEVTLENLFRETGFSRFRSRWLRDAIRSTRRKLLSAGEAGAGIPKLAANLSEFKGVLIDLDADEWCLNPYCETIRRAQLRSDVAEIAWPFLREEIKSNTFEVRSISAHYRAFRWAGELLGAAVPDLRTAQLKAIQAAWNSCDIGGSQLRQTRWALARLFTCLSHEAQEDTSIDHAEVSRIITWLAAQTIPSKRSAKDFLTEEELNTVINCCLKDIEEGIVYTQGKPHLLRASTLEGNEESAVPVVNWAIALIVLLMTLTGLRPQSVKRLKISDWMQLFPHVTAVAWQHDKKKESNIVAIPLLLARLLDLYVELTDVVRQSLGTKQLFLISDRHIQWRCFDTEVNLQIRIEDFVARHNIIRDGVPLHITPTMLRRTYVTHQLHKGRSILFVSAQLGHTQIRSTMIYAQYDRFEHPAQVGAALDEYGRRVLDLWQTPVDVMSLSPQERATLFAAEVDQSQTDEGSSDPCATCDHLYSGPQFLSEWAEQLKIRTERLREIEADPSKAYLVAEEEADFELFLSNFERIKLETPRYE